MAKEREKKAAVSIFSTLVIFFLIAICFIIPLAYWLGGSTQNSWPVVFVMLAIILALLAVVGMHFTVKYIKKSTYHPEDKLPPPSDKLKS
jgi:protein-S-isoprenylcysteine O-methyltransferase Ste14